MTRSGFTLVELVVVVLILGILAAVAAPKFFDMVKESQITATMADVRAIEKAATAYYANHGAFPSFTYYFDEGNNNLPGDFDGYLDPRYFKKTPPIGGSNYFWYQVAGEYVGTALYESTPPVSVWQEIDDRFDDGNLATGNIIQYETTSLVFIYYGTGP